MATLAFISFILVAALVTVGPVMFLKLQKKGQTDKNFERGISMVSLLIHLPPPSDDTEANGRDTRDIVDENISKAQIIYNIISSTTDKNLKNRWYGQKHFSFEIVGVQGRVYFYTAVPADMIDVMKQAVVSAYPSAQLEIVNEHNIFNQVGRLSGTVGGELHLKEPFAYPIATYQDLKRDALQSLLNALSTLEKEDGAAIQILFRPADSSWRKAASSLASKKRKGKDKGVNASLLARQMMTAFVKPPEGKDEGGQPAKHELSSLEQSVVDSIDDKTRHPGFEVSIRVVASSNISQRAQSILNNVVASFSLFDAPGKNGFKYAPAKDMATFVTHYILRFFSPHKKKDILNAVELATLFHFPDQSNIPTSQLQRQESKQVDGPRNMPEDGMLLGFNVFRGVKKPIRLSIGDRRRHMYAVGQTGTGKSTFLENLALQDMLNGNGFAFVDPHGDTVESLLSMVPKERTEDVIYFNPADMDYPMGLNLFEFNNPDQKDFLIQEAINMLYKLYDPQHQGIIGPRYEHLFRNAALAIMADPEGGTFVDIPKLFRDPQYVKQKLQHVTDLNVREFWEKEMPQSQRSNEFGDIVSWFVSKFGAFLSNEMMRNIIGQTKSGFDLRDVMDNKKILLVNLSKGRVGELNSKLLGMVFVMKFQAAAMSRSNIPEEERQDFCLYVDEFQNFSTDSFATIMSEARKYRLNLIVANQFTTQLTDEIRDAVFGNIGTIVSYRIGQNDVESLSRYFQPVFDGDDLLRVPNYNAIVRSLVSGVPTQPFSMVALPPLGNPNADLADALKQLSAAKYGRPRKQVEKIIFDRLATQEPPKPAYGTSNPFGAANQQPGGMSRPGAPASPYGPPVAPAMPGSGSFLDEWLAKQRAGQPVPNRAIPTGPPPAAIQTMSQPMAASGPVVPTAPPPAGSQPFAVPGPQISTSRPHPQPSSVTGPPPSQPVPAHLTPQPAFNQAATAGNVSSAQLDQQEINGIAAKLKKDLHHQTAVLAHALDGPGQLPSQPTAQPAGANGELKIERPKSSATPGAAAEADKDTIFIDQEGMFHDKPAGQAPPNPPAAP